ncbi:MAG: carbon storage regulator CsrA [Planctomycetota bacterium]
MLVLTRTLEEEIRIGDQVTVRVLEVKGDRVRLGIDAPPEITVHRQEVYLEIERANRGAGPARARGLLKGHPATGARTDARAGKGAPAAGKRKRNRNRRIITEVSHGT